MKHHKTIQTLPIANFEECKKGKLQYLYVCDFFDVPDDYPESFVQIYNELFYQLPNPDMVLPNLRYKIALNYNKALTENARSYISKAQSLEIEYQRILRQRKRQSENYNFYKTLEALEQWRKTPIDIYKTTTAHFYTMIEQYEKYVSQINAKNGR